MSKPYNKYEKKKVRADKPGERQTNTTNQIKTGVEVVPSRPDEKDPADKALGTDKSKGTASESGAKNEMGILDMFFTLMNMERKNKVPNLSEDFFAFQPSGLVKVPVRSEMNVSRVIPTEQKIYCGIGWLCYDGTVTTPLNVFNGLAYAAQAWAEISYDPSTPWQGSTWWYSIGGGIYHALTNFIRANNNITKTNMIKHVKAIVGYMEIAAAVLLFETYYWNRLDGPINLALASILSSSGGSARFASKDDLRGAIIHNLEETFFPWPVLDFFLSREGFCGAIPYEAPWYKYLLLVPWSPKVFLNGLARLFDCYQSTQIYYHPETYLRAQKLWNEFETNVVPIIWDKKDHSHYRGIHLEKYLLGKGWNSRNYNPIMREWYENKFWLHPFDDLLGTGMHKLPKDCTTRSTGTKDQVIPFQNHYWDVSTTEYKGQTFYLNPLAYTGKVYSPWLDFLMFNYICRYNHSVNNDDCNPGEGHTLAGDLSFDGGTFTVLSKNTFFAVMAYAFDHNKMELVEPDPDVDLITIIESESGYVTLFDLIRYFKHPLKDPVKMPDLHWYQDPRQIEKLYAYFMNVNLDDYEVFKLQRERDVLNGNAYDEVAGDMQGGK